MILVIDNYDSFVYNLVHYLKELGREVSVIRNNRITIDQVRLMKPESIVISPGPCTPAESGICTALAGDPSLNVPILGVCLGHQAIGVSFGGRITRALRPEHGKQSLVWHDGSGVFDGIPSPLAAGRYHSLVVSTDSFPSCLLINAWSEDGQIMGIRHSSLPVHGVQFHPESILTPCGKKILENFLALYN